MSHVGVHAWYLWHGRECWRHRNATSLIDTVSRGAWEPFGVCDKAVGTSVALALAEWGSQFWKLVYLSPFANMEAVMYAEVVFIDQIHDNNTIKSPIKVFNSILKSGSSLPLWMACNLLGFIGVNEFKQTLGKCSGEVRTLVELWFYSGLQVDEAKPLLEPGGRGRFPAAWGPHVGEKI